jgi:hypothetical protein
MLFCFLITVLIVIAMCQIYSFKGPELHLKVVFAVSIVEDGHQHINFMATPRDKPADVQLFFAEHASKTGIVLCCPVQNSVSRSGKFFLLFYVHNNFANKILHIILCSQ